MDTTAAASTDLLKIRDLKITFHKQHGEPFQAVKGINLELKPARAWPLWARAAAARA